MSGVKYGHAYAFVMIASLSCLSYRIRDKRQRRSVPREGLNRNVILDYSPL